MHAQLQQRLAIPLEAIQAAQKRLQGVALHTPLVRFEVFDVPAEIYLKLENLQPTGSFKIRSAANALATADPKDLARGVWTASAGNFGLALARMAERKGTACQVVLPEETSSERIEALKRLGAETILAPFSTYQEIQRRHEYEGMQGRLIHPFSDANVMAGNGVIALEILQDLPDIDAVLIPYGGGGLSCGIASALRALRPNVRIYACEVATAAPLAASMKAGAPVKTSYSNSFVTGIGAPFVFPEMWPLANQLLDGSFVVEISQVADAIRQLAKHNHIIAEGAGGVAVAAAMSGRVPAGKVVCIVSGGNINTKTLVRILEDENVPK